MVAEYKCSKCADTFTFSPQCVITSQSSYCHVAVDLICLCAECAVALGYQELPNIER